MSGIDSAAAPQFVKIGDALVATSNLSEIATRLAMDVREAERVVPLSQQVPHKLTSTEAARLIEDTLRKLLSAPRPARPDAGEAVAKLSHNLAVYIDRAEDAGLETVPVPFGEASDICTLLQGIEISHPPAASAEKARIAELADAWLATWENSGLTVECRDVVSAEEWNAFARLMDAEAVKRRAALGAQEVQS